jgi:hypothetical protein
MARPEHLARVRKSGRFIAVTAMTSSRSTQASASVRDEHDARLYPQSTTLHHGRMTGREAAFFIICGQDRARIRIRGPRLTHKVRFVIGGRELMQGWRRHWQLIRVPGSECLGHETREALFASKVSSARMTAPGSQASVQASLGAAQERRRRHLMQ